MLVALERRRKTFPGLKALASVEITKSGRKRAFDSVGVVLDGLRRFRIEVYGPLGESQMTLVWDGQDLLSRVPGHETMRNGSGGIGSILDRDLTPAELCAVLSGNAPATSPGSATLFCGPHGACDLVLRQGEDLRRIGVQLPASDGGELQILSLELFRNNSLIYHADFAQQERVNDVLVPKRITLETNGIRLKVHYSDVTVTGSFRDAAFSLPAGQAPRE